MGQDPPTGLGLSQSDLLYTRNSILQNYKGSTEREDINLIILQVYSCAPVDRQNHSSSEYESLFLHQECLGKVKAKHNSGARNVQCHQYAFNCLKKTMEAGL